MKQIFSKDKDRVCDIFCYTILVIEDKQND